MNTGQDRPLSLKHLYNLLEEFESRIQLLLFFVVRIVAVLAHQDDAVDGEFARSERQRISDTCCDRHTVAFASR